MQFLCTYPSSLKIKIYLSFGLCSNKTSTTLGSANVDMSPKSRSPAAILRNTRRIIFPDRVLGSPGAS